MKRKHIILAIILAFLNAGAIFLIFGFRQYGDTSGFQETINGFLGKGAFASFPWILRPLGPILAIPFEFLGTGAGLVVQNIVFYSLSTLLMFKIVDLVYQNKKQALLASFFFCTSVSVIEYGLAYLTDMGAWFFYILSIFLTLQYFRTKNQKLVVLNGFLTGLGFLMKENGGLGILFFLMMVLLSQEFNFKEKVMKIANFALFFLIPVAALEITALRCCQFSSLDWYFAKRPTLILGQEGWLLVSLRWLGQIAKVLGVLWIFFFIGLWRQISEKDWPRIKIYLALIPSSLSFLLWSVEAAGRSAFIMAPMGIMLATYGLCFLCPKAGRKSRIFILALTIAAVLFVNYSFTWLNPNFSFIDKIVGFLGLR